MSLENLYPENWDQIRKFVYTNANYTCQYCGEKCLGVNAHHVKPLSKGGDNTFNNLVCICDQCHSIIHNVGKENLQLHVKHLHSLVSNYEDNDQFYCPLWNTIKTILFKIENKPIEDEIIRNFLNIGVHEMGYSICDQCNSIVGLAAKLGCVIDDIELCFLYQMGIFYDDQSFHYIEDNIDSRV